MQKTCRIGQIAPSSNTTMETEIPAMTGKPMVTAAIATTCAMLKALGLDTCVPDGGALLSGAC